MKSQAGFVTEMYKKKIAIKNFFKMGMIKVAIYHFMALEMFLLTPYHKSRLVKNWPTS